MLIGFGMMGVRVFLANLKFLQDHHNDSESGILNYLCKSGKEDQSLAVASECKCQEDERIAICQWQAKAVSKSEAVLRRTYKELSIALTFEMSIWCQLT